MTGLLQDLRYALRQLRKSPGFTAVAIITLALGIGANTAIFSLINAIMLRTLPVRDPQSLVILEWVARRPAKSRFEYMVGGCPGDPSNPVACSFSFPLFQQAQAEGQVFSSVVAFAPAQLDLKISGHSNQVSGLLVSGNFFSTLGVRPAVGRVLTSFDDSSSANPVVVVSHRFWQNVLRSDTAAVGKFVLIGKTTFTIIGVTSSGLLELDPGVSCDFWLPLSSQPDVFPIPYPTASNVIWLELMARLRTGVNARQAGSAISAMFAASTTNGSEALFAPADGPHIELSAAAHGFASLRQVFSQPLFVLFMAAASVLLVACANIAGLLLARSARRRKEIALRCALGATPARIIRQLLTESLLLSLAGGAVGIFFGYCGAESLAVFLSKNLPYMALQVNVHPDWRVLAFAALVSGIVGLLFGLAPALSIGRVEVIPALKERSRSLGVTPGRRITLGNALVVVQMALAMLVLVGTGLLVGTLVNLRSTKLGFDPQNLLLFSLDTTNTTRTGAGLDNIYHDLQEQIAALPGVTSATYSSRGFLSNGGDEDTLVPEDQPNISIQINRLYVAPDFFKTMRIPLLAGRPLNAQDLKNAQSKNGSAMNALVINRALARRLFRDQNAVGRYFRVGGAKMPRSEIVGVVGDGRYDSLREPIMPTVFPPMTNPGGVFEVRTALNPKAMMPEIRAAVARFDPNLSIIDMKTQEEQIDRNIYQERLIANLSGLFALLALIIACIGIYGLLSYQVTLRTQEIGIRLALGAQREDVLRIVLRQGAVLAVLGVLIGVAAALAVTRYLQSFLFGVKPSDPATITAVAVGLIALALLASYIPARRAMKTDPIVALRYE